MSVVVNSGSSTSLCSLSLMLNVVVQKKDILLEVNYKDSWNSLWRDWNLRLRKISSSAVEILVIISVHIHADINNNLLCLMVSLRKSITS